MSKIHEKSLTPPVTKKRKKDSEKFYGDSASEDEAPEAVEDPYKSHLNFDVEVISSMVAANKFHYKNTDKENSALGCVQTSTIEELVTSINCPCETVSFHAREVLLNNFKMKNAEKLSEECDDTYFTSFQKSIFKIINHYQDLWFCERNFSNCEDLMSVYALHVLNHVLKSKKYIIKNNYKLSKNPSEECRDQGFTRPKVLILVPFRYSALRVVETFMSLLTPSESDNVLNKKRFYEEFGCDDMPQSKKPWDFQQLFKGNIDDSFRIGVAIKKKSMKLFSDFYSSDIIIASPLGLRTLIGVEGESERDYDFLSSLEILIIDQCDVFLMQNWDHVLHVLAHCHLQPNDSHGVDFSRVRMIHLNGLSKYFRQTMLFNSVACPEVAALFHRHCLSHSGRVKLNNPVSLGSISQVIIQLPQTFVRFDVPSHSQVSQMRKDNFLQHILPKFKDSLLSHTLIIVPSYFDYVTLRNYMKKEEISFTHICEYTKKLKVARSRNLLYDGKRHFLLMTERFHFYHRYTIKGIHHIIFYELPHNAAFYSEWCNMLQDVFQNPKCDSAVSKSCTVQFCKYDFLRLSQIVGTDKAKSLITSDKSTHLLVSS